MNQAPLWAKIGLLLYCLTGGFFFKLVIGAVASWNQVAYHPLQTPAFWLATLVTAPIMFGMNRDRLDRTFDFKARLVAASHRMILGAGILLVLLIIPKRPNFFAEYMLIGCLSDLILKFCGPYRPWDIVKSRLEGTSTTGVPQP